MASLPKKGVKGANLRKWLIDSIEQLIDYLHSTRVRPGPGISVRETPSGVIVSLAKKSTSTVNNSTAGGETQDISATVTGSGMATVATIELSGSTSAVNIRPANSNIQISGGTTGEILIGATGGTGGTAGLPDYNTSTATPVQLDTPYTASSNVWIIGHAGVYSDLDASLVLHINSNISITLFETHHGLEHAITEYVPVCIPIPAGNTFELTGYGNFTLKIFDSI